ncbi:hypothetical protein BDP27DRAFT_1450755 [Rhodocollybia butyracea]|uniref:DUF1772-domain-containing protein n=1 Tax=Rhodocollybia butyracea TaxID=206335 RepID=A0A9P5U303_9AGAR|nr:hypothetical protein BDP27DRAFT_1450755 [Rhodocollybia butyracea]
MSALAGLPTVVRIAAALGSSTSGSAWCSGAIMGVTFLGVSALLEPSLPATTAAHAPIFWHQICLRGTIMPVIAVCTALTSFYAAYSIPNPATFQVIGATRNLLAVAGLLTVSIVPYTLIIMKPTYDALYARARVIEDRNKKGMEILDDGTNELIGKWNALNLRRGVLPLLATGLAIYAIF